MKNLQFDVQKFRSNFPACSLEIAGVPIAYLDGPGGTQVPQRVIDAITGYLINDNANEGGNFKASYKTDIVEQEAFEAAADFLGCSPQEVGFSVGSTQHSYNFSVNIAKPLRAGDELIITEIDHRCNSQPWRRLGKLGFEVKQVRLDTETQQLDFEDFEAKLSDRTRVVAGMLTFYVYESPLSEKLRAGLRRLSGVTVYGPAEGEPRTPTVAFTMDGYAPDFVTKVLGDKGINAWHGDFYAIEVISAFGLIETGGLIRVGMAPYCTEADIDRTIATITAIAEGDYDGYDGSGKCGGQK